MPTSDSGENDVSSPASIEKVIAVGAIDENKRIASFSQGGDNEGLLTRFTFDDRKDPNKKVEVVAPGVDIVSTWTDEGYAEASGTSQAVPFVTSVLALVLEAKPSYMRANEDKVEDMKEKIMNSAEKLPDQETPHDDHYGYGLIRGKELLSGL